MGILIFNGLSSKDRKIEVWQPPDYRIPEREYETIHIPGRNGDLMIDKKSFKNTFRSYIVSFANPGKQDYVMLANALAEWLYSASGYARLEDSYEPEYYRLAMYQKSVDITNIYQTAGYTSIEFNCKPQRFLKIGDKPVKFTTTTQRFLTNPTGFASEPIIKVYGNGEGEVKIGNSTITILSVTEFLIIDCDLMEVYKNETNNNSKIKLSDNRFPELFPGRNDISFSGDVTSVEVIPRWWTI